MKRPHTIDLARLTLRQYAALVAEPPLHRPADLAARAGIAKPRASEVLRGVRVYPAALARVRTALGLSRDVELFDVLLENSRRAEETAT